MRKTVPTLLLVLFLSNVYATEPAIDIRMNTVEYPDDGILNHNYVIHTTVWLKDYISYYPFLYPNKTPESHTFDIALVDNGRLYEVKTVTFYATTPENPDSLRKDVDFVWSTNRKGVHLLSLLYDYADEIPELKEDNNDFTFRVYIYPTKKEYYTMVARGNRYLLVLVGLYLFLVIYHFGKKLL
ncbi:MAG: hypothetical protein ACE5PM_01240 [Candidatus Hydrothermarchaeales archaeon]